MTGTFNLRASVRDVIESSTLHDPGDIANEVIKRLKPAEAPLALHAAMRSFVRQVISEQRQPVHFAYVPPVDAVLVPSSKVATIREDWKRGLRFVKLPTVDGWKPLGACTRDDLLHAADARESQGKANLAKARQYRDLASTLNEHAVVTVADLPVDVLRVAIGQVAA